MPAIKHKNHYLSDVLERRDTFIQANYSKSREQNYDADLQIAQSQIKLWYSEVQGMNYKTKVQIWKSKYLPQVPQSIVCSQPPSE